MRAMCLVWLDADDCIAPHGLDMRWQHDAAKVDMLEEAFRTRGFDESMPALVGYPINGKVQLLSGTHRHRAAERAKIKLPVTIWLRSDVESTWGTDLWPTVIKDIAVRDLRDIELPEGERLAPYERVEFA